MKFPFMSLPYFFIFFLYFFDGFLPYAKSPLVSVWRFLFFFVFRKSFAKVTSFRFFSGRCRVCKIIKASKIMRLAAQVEICDILARPDCHAAHPRLASRIGFRTFELCNVCTICDILFEFLLRRLFLQTPTGFCIAIDQIFRGHIARISAVAFASINIRSFFVVSYRLQHNEPPKTLSWLYFRAIKARNTGGKPHETSARSDLAVKKVRLVDDLIISAVAVTQDAPTTELLNDDEPPKALADTVLDLLPLCFVGHDARTFPACFLEPSHDVGLVERADISAVAATFDFAATKLLDDRQIIKFLPCPVDKVAHHSASFSVFLIPSVRSSAGGPKRRYMAALVTIHALPPHFLASSGKK